MRHATSPVVYFNGSELRAWPFFHSFMWLLLKIFNWNFLYYHLVSIFLHGINGYLCWIFLEKINIKNSLWVAIIYLIHPLQLFNVAWIIQIKTLLSVMFFLISIITLEKFYTENKKRYYLFSFLFFSLSILSKSTTAILSLCFVALYPFVNTKYSLKHFIKLIIPFLMVSLTAIALTAWNPQLRSLSKLALILMFFIIALIKYRETIRENLYLILPLLFPISIIFFSYKSNLNLLFLIIALAIIVMTFKYSEQISTKKFKAYQTFCFLFIFFTLNLGDFLYVQINRIPFESLIFTLVNFIRYVEFIVLPINNFLFSRMTTISLSSFEFFQLCLFFSLFFKLYYYFYKEKKFIIQAGLTFFMIGILPFCGIFNIPIFTYSNFNPYWLSIPFLGILPLISHCFQSRLQLGLIALFLMITTHVQSYQFVHTEKVFIEPIKNSPENIVLQLSLIEHYVFVGDCKNAQALFKKNQNDVLIAAYSTEAKVKNCKDRGL